MSQLAHDLRAAIRNIRRRPLIPIVAVTILALGLAACVAVFTYINGFQQSFPGVEARGLVRVFEVEPADPLSLAGGAFVLVLAALLATYFSYPPRGNGRSGGRIAQRVVAATQRDIFSRYKPIGSL
ncbi:MAG: hypothetical protein WBP34_03920 [Thermoanaerobaculia bacterium]